MEGVGGGMCELCNGIFFAQNALKHTKLILHHLLFHMMCEMSMTVGKRWQINSIMTRFLWSRFYLYNSKIDSPRSHFVHIFWANSRKSRANQLFMR